MTRGFTLAEVLITLAIIGVVSALTIPTLVQNYKKKVIETRLLKVYSLMNQAIELSTIDNGPVETWENLGTFANSTATYDDIYAWWQFYFAPYLKVQKIEHSLIQENALMVYFLDGSVLMVPHYIYDMSFFPFGNTEHVVWGKDRFGFRFYPVLLVPMSESVKYSVNPGFVPYAYDWDGTYDGTKYSNNGYGCFQDGALCTKMIQMNDWKIPDDYPYKF